MFFCKFLTVADTLSRAPLPYMQSSSALQDDVTACVFAITHNPSCHVDNQRLRSTPLLDPIASRLSDFILHGWPSKSNTVPSDLLPYFPFCAQLSVANDLIYCGNRIFVPESCRCEVLSTLHEGHQGITKCRTRACDTVWWPSVAQEIATFITNCAICVNFHTRCNQLSDCGRLFFPFHLSPALLQQPVQPSFVSSTSCLLPTAYRQPLSQTMAPSFLQPSLQSSPVSLVSIVTLRRQSLHIATVRLSMLLRQPRTSLGRTPMI